MGPDQGFRTKILFDLFHIFCTRLHAEFWLNMTNDLVIAKLKYLTFYRLRGQGLSKNFVTVVLILRLWIRNWQVLYDALAFCKLGTKIDASLQMLLVGNQNLAKTKVKEGSSLIQNSADDLQPWTWPVFYDALPSISSVLSSLEIKNTNSRRLACAHYQLQ